MLFEADVVCHECSGTGIYTGLGERNGAGVVCHTCKGSGCLHVRQEFEQFVARKVSSATHVYAANPGIVAAPGVVPGGVPMQEWLSNPESVKRQGAEMRQHTCPSWWYQSADYKRKPDWQECWDNLGHTFSQCPRFSNKQECWAKFDKETPNA